MVALTVAVAGVSVSEIERKIKTVLNKFLYQLSTFIFQKKTKNSQNPTTEEINLDRHFDLKKTTYTQ